MLAYRKSLSWAMAIGLAGQLNVSTAQTPPDAGRVLQEAKPDRVRPLAPSTDVRIQPPPLPESASGGAQVTLRSVSVRGAEVFDEQTLRALLGPVAGQAFDLAGLRALAARITLYYRGKGYPFARAYLPAQDLQSGNLVIDVLEGRYGEVLAVGDEALLARAQEFLAPLRAGAPIEASALERATLILGDQPGIDLVPVLRPGAAVGRGDLQAQVSAASRLVGQIGIDNHGNRYTGTYRVYAEAHIQQPFSFGDQLTLGAMVSDEQMWFGRVLYSRPLGSDGLRGQLGYSRSAYELAGEFASLQVSGIADVYVLGLSYPFLRSQRSNVIGTVSPQYKVLDDRFDVAATRNEKSSRSLPVGLQFDHRDGLGGGGLSYGSLIVTLGRLSLDSPALRESDAVTARTQGSFGKLNVDLARLQNLSEGLSLYARAAAQWTDENLDSSEKFVLGGAGGVRAFPSGEGFGDRGWLTQWELRHAAAGVEPYLFFDAGRVEINAAPWAAGENRRGIAGAGLGLRYESRDWYASLTAAWRTHGGTPQADSKDQVPQIWGALAYRFQ